MPIHDWTRVDAGLFHAFHQTWITSICTALNNGGLPPDYFALPEQRIHGPIPDVLTLRLAHEATDATEPQGGLVVAAAPPRTRHVIRHEADIYAKKADRIAIHHRHGDVVSVIEIVSPGNKASRAEFRSFVEKSTEPLRQKIHLLVIDLFPPGPRDPHGIHKAIWDEFEEQPFDVPPDKPLTLASYDVGEATAYVEQVGVGDPLPEIPLFLRPGIYVPAPLEATYQTTWGVFPAAVKGLIEPPKP